MKKMMVVLAAAAVSAFAWAKGVEQISVVENEIATISVPFGITSYLPSNKDVVRIEELSGTSLRITALRRGRCDLEVRGDKDLSQKYEITVLGDLATTLDNLVSELDSVQEARTRVVGDFIRIDGEISSIQKWEYLTKVLRNYPGVVRNFAVFSPGPDVMLRLKDTLQDAGFTVVFQPLGKERKAWPAEEIALVLNKQTQILTVQGRVYTPERQSKVLDCLSTERWLALDLKPADGKDDSEFRIRTQFDVFVDRPQIRISVAYMAIDEGDVKRIGNSSVNEERSALDVHGIAQSLIGVLRNSGGAFGGFVDSSGTKGYSSQAANIGADLNIATRFFKGHNITRISNIGYTVMESWDKDGAKFKSGGTMYVKTPGLNAGDLKEIEWGLILKTKGGIVPSGDSVDATIDFMSSQVTPVGVDAYDRTEKASTQHLILPLGRTSFIGGEKLLDDKRSSPSGLPFLRNTPVLNWFIADSGTEVNDKRLVIMICPEIVDNTRDGTLETEKEINIPVSTDVEKPTEQLEDERRPHEGGIWNPLNWFVF